MDGRQNIEYLLAAYPTSCCGVMRRIQADDFRHKLEGRPALWQPLLDLLAEDESLTSIRDALRLVFIRALDDRELLTITSRYCIDLELARTDAAGKRMARIKARDCAPAALGLMRHRAVRIVLAVVELLRIVDHSPYPYFTANWPPDLIREFARRVAGSALATERVREILAGDAQALHPTCASILCAANVDWRPDKHVSLHAARLDHAAWRGISLPGVNFTAASLIEADLSDANLEDACFHGARMQRANLRGACLNRAHFVDARLAGADFTLASANQACFKQADLIGAKLASAQLRNADFSLADVRGATMAGANLADALFIGTEVEGVDFRGANLQGAHLMGLLLRETLLDGAKLRLAYLHKCDLEFVRLPGVNFERAKLYGSWLTGSYMPEANLGQADLRNTGLADVEWEGVNLWGADLRGCSFHMGSSRSGLVGSPYPGHGSRTGFYTDSYDDRYHKAPEEIRKANLRGADLRNANIEGVDFYLVDLRDAQYDADQARHFRRCDAILEEFV